MNSTTNNWIRMIRACIKTLSAYGSVWDGFTKFEDYNSDLIAAMVIVDLKANALMEINKGPKLEKERLRGLMVVSCMKNSGSGYAFADDTENTLLLEKMDFRKSDLLRLVDSEQANKAEMVYNVLHPIVGSLVDYKVTAPDLATLKSRVDAYREFLTAPKNNADLGTGLREEQLIQVKKCLRLLKKMDRLMDHFEEDNHEFVTVYTKSRVIVDLGHHYKKPICEIAGLIKIAGTTNVLREVSITIEGDEKHGVVSNASGLFYLGAYQDGEVVLVFELEGYVRKEVPLLILKGENQEVNVELEAVVPNPPPPDE